MPLDTKLTHSLLTAAWCRQGNVAFHSSNRRHSLSPRCQHLDITSPTRVSQYFSSPTLWNRRQSPYSTHPSPMWLTPKNNPLRPTPGQTSLQNFNVLYTCSPASASLQPRLTAAAPLSSRTLARRSLPITDGRPKLLPLHRQQTG